MSSSEMVGRILLNQYRVDAFIATGGMATVYQVFDLHRNVPLAMKVLHADLAEDPHMYDRFKREANALKRLAHPNIVPFYGLFEFDDFPFMLEYFVDGPTLKDILRYQKGRPLPFSDVLIYAKSICSALSYAHNNGVVHCDIKPGNVMVDRGGIVYLADFGIARHIDSTLTTMASAGTTAYMAPEQVRGEAVSPATDIYALGVTLFEMLTGERMFRGNEKGAEKGGNTANDRIRYAHLKLSPPDPRTLNPAISAELARVVLKAVEKQPEQRFQSTNEMMSALAAALGANMGGITNRVEPAANVWPEPALVRPAKPLVGQAQSLNLPPISTPASQVEPAAGSPARKKPNALLWMLGAGAVVVIILVLLMAGGGGGDPPRLPTSVLAGGVTQAPTALIIASTATEAQVIGVVTPMPNGTPTDAPTHTLVRALTLTPTLAPTETSVSSCPGAEPQRVKVGKRAVVCTKQDRLILREAPDLDGKEILRIAPGTAFDIVGGPSCADNSSWWRIKLETNLTGWVREGSDDRDLYFICLTN